MQNVTVKNSKIQGRGVFANRNFAKGETVMEWDTTKVLIESDARKIPQKNKKYLVFSNGLYIFSKSPEKYLNHSCSPNTKEKYYCDVAIRDIMKGEELMTDYSKDAPPHIKLKCNCKSKNCRKIV